MANPEHVKIFRRGVGAWNRWRHKHRGERPDLSDADLQRAFFRYANLNDANLERANLGRANLDRAYLEGAELSGASPRGAHFFSADLRASDLRGADLRDCQLWHAHLDAADLREARLEGADLRYAALCGADLRGADLRRANLSGADLRRADLRDATLEETRLHGTRFDATRLDGAALGGARVALASWNDVDLSGVAGLDAMRHERPSSVGADTLARTAAGLARRGGDGGALRVFLRAAGVPASLFEDLERLAETAQTVYVGHSLADRDFARALCAELRRRGVRCWRHEHPMIAGEELDPDFDLGPRGGDRLILCWSPAARASWWLGAELDAAREAGRPVVAINLGGDDGARGWEKPRAERGLAPLAAEFSGWENGAAAFERGVERLIAALRRPINAPNTRHDP